MFDGTPAEDDPSSWSACLRATRTLLCWTFMRPDISYLLIRSYVNHVDHTRHNPTITRPTYWREVRLRDVIGRHYQRTVCRYLQLVQVDVAGKVAPRIRRQEISFESWLGDLLVVVVPNFDGSVASAERLRDFAGKSAFRARFVAG